jgi:uncharacterized protein YwgA
MTIDIPSLIHAAGGEIVGKVRLQKIVYLLDQMGFATGFSFSYHHYGPYSEELADSVEEDVIFRRVSQESRRRGDGIPFMVYKVPEGRLTETMSAMLDDRRAKGALKAMQCRSATILELAATIHWLAFVEEESDWRSDLVRRKGVKTESGRTEEALALLRELQIAPREVAVL